MADPMEDSNNDDLQALVFKNRGLLLTIPAALLALFGRPSATSVAVGLPVAIAGELIRCWAVGYSGATTRGDRVEAPHLVTAGPYAYVRNPLYVGNFVTALGFAVAFTGKNSFGAKVGLIGGSLAAMAALYATIVPHEEAFLHSEFGEAFERYCERVPPVIPLSQPAPGEAGTWNPSVIREAESRTFATFGAMLGTLVLKTLRA
jgi:protein-S-isoprenylcysteine O-methyltransferase Ste14